jgi:hypothetical protein
MTSVRAPRIARDGAVGRPVTKIDIDHPGRSTDRGKIDAYHGSLPVLAARLKRSSRRAQRFAFPTTDTHLAAITGGAGKYCRIKATLLPHEARQFFRSSGTLPPFSASLIITCLCSQIFIAAESLASPV